MERQRIGSGFRFVKQTLAVTSAVESRKTKMVRAVDKIWLSNAPDDSEGHSVILMVQKMVPFFVFVLFISSKLESRS